MIFIPTEDYHYAYYNLRGRVPQIGDICVVLSKYTKPKAPFALFGVNLTVLHPSFGPLTFYFNARMLEDCHE